MGDGGGVASVPVMPLEMGNACSLCSASCRGHGDGKHGKDTVYRYAICHKPNRDTDSACRCYKRTRVLYMYVAPPQQVLKSALSLSPLVHADLKAAVVRHGEVRVPAPLRTHVRLEVLVPHSRGYGVVAQHDCAGAEVGFDELERGEGHGCPDCVVSRCSGWAGSQTSDSRI